MNGANMHSMPGGRLCRLIVKCGLPADRQQGLANIIWAELLRALATPDLHVECRFQLRSFGPSQSFHKERRWP